MTQEITKLIETLRSLRASERRLRASLVDDLRNFQKPDDKTFFTLPFSKRQGISVATTCTALMALIDSDELERLVPGEAVPVTVATTADTTQNPIPPSAGPGTQCEVTTADSALKPVPGQPAIAAEVSTGSPLSPGALFRSVVSAAWSSSDLDDLNAFTSCMVIRAAGFLVSAGYLTTEEAGMLQHEKATALEGRKTEPGVVEKALSTKNKPTIDDVVHAIAGNAPESFSIPGYPPKAAMAYWFVDGIDKAGIQLGLEAWKKLSIWASGEFERQLSYVVSGNDALMDPASLAMATSLVMRLRKICGKIGFLSDVSKGLPSTFELMHAVQQVFATQTESGIWNKAFPLFHFPGSGAADYCFSFEFLEAILIEFSELNLLADPYILDRISKAVTWCARHRLRFRQGERDYYGWNAGGEVTNLAAGVPEAWATGAVHMFLWELDSSISNWLQKLILERRFSRAETPLVKKWETLIDVDMVFPGDEKPSLKQVLETELIRPAALAKANEESLRRRPLKSRRSALLFGPPGTSKTTVAKGIAGELTWPLLVITPSDFLSLGLEQIYVRATEIFQDLMDLSGVVILFDEMDALAQTRGNAALDVTRQLLTTSMLPKLADLHDLGRVIFLMATNHKKDLDPAITRPGRFDLLLCVGPPSWTNKIEGMKEVLKDLPAGDVAEVQKNLKEFSDSVATKEQLDLFTVADLRSFLEHVRRRERAETLSQALGKIDRDTFQHDVSIWAKSYITLSEADTRLPETDLDLRTEYDRDKQASRIQ